MSGEDLDAWYDQFNLKNDGKRLYFGQFLQDGKGVCSQQALLLKLAVDEFPDMQAKLIRGNYNVGKPDKLNHAWTEIDFKDGKPPLVFDPRHQIMGERYGEGKASLHTPGRDVNARLGKPNPLDVSPGDKVVYGGKDVWKIQKIEGDNAVIVSNGNKDATEANLAVWNNNRKVNLGDSYTLRRSSGEMESGWVLIGRNPNGTLLFSKLIRS